VPEFADVILVLSDSNFPYVNEPVKEIELEKKKNNHEVLSCHCGVLGKHVIFFCEIIDNDNRTKQRRKFNIIICPTAQSEFIKSLKDFAMQKQRPLQVVLMGKHAYEFPLRKIQQSSSI
jgi:hypothetical protein